MVSADVTDLVAMTQALDKIQRRFGTLHGVIHAAGVLRDGLMAGKSQSDIEEVFTPKIHGTLVLDELLRSIDLDFFLGRILVDEHRHRPGRSGRLCRGQRVSQRLRAEPFGNDTSADPGSELGHLVRGRHDGHGSRSSIDSRPGVRTDQASRSSRLVAAISTRLR